MGWKKARKCSVVCNVRLHWHQLMRATRKPLPNARRSDRSGFNTGFNADVSRFPSEADAQDFVERQLRLGDPVATGKTEANLGYRYVIRSRSTRACSIFRRCGSDVIVIESQSLSHALEFERR